MTEDQALQAFPILRFFAYAHLPHGPARDASRLFCELAWQTGLTAPTCAETSAGLRKLLEAKDCIVRASLPVDL